MQLTCKQITGERIATSIALFGSPFAAGAPVDAAILPGNFPAAKCCRGFSEGAI